MLVLPHEQDTSFSNFCVMNLWWKQLKKTAVIIKERRRKLQLNLCFTLGLFYYHHKTLHKSGSHCRAPQALGEEAEGRKPQWPRRARGWSHPSPLPPARHTSPRAPPNRGPAATTTRPGRALRAPAPPRPSPPPPTCSETARKRQETSLAVILRYSPRLPRYSSMATSLKDFCPKYFFQPFCILPGRRGPERQRQKRRWGAPRGTLRCACHEGARLLLMRRRAQRAHLRRAAPARGPQRHRPRSARWPRRGCAPLPLPADCARGSRALPGRAPNTCPALPLNARAPWGRFLRPHSAVSPSRARLLQDLPRDERGVLAKLTPSSSIPWCACDCK